MMLSHLYSCSRIAMQLLILSEIDYEPQMPMPSTQQELSLTWESTCIVKIDYPRMTWPS